MNAAQRLKMIRDLIVTEYSVDLQTLCDLFDISISTARRDLDKLQSLGVLRRTHGGAVITDALGQRQAVHADNFISNNLLADVATGIIHNGEILFLGGGDVCLAIALKLKGAFKGIVVTNSMNIVIELSDAKDIELIVLGGNLQSINGYLITDGELLLSGLEGIVVNRAFVAVSGLTKEHGYFVPSITQKKCYDILHANALETYAVIDKKKYDSIGQVRLGGLSYFKHVITPATVSSSYVATFNNAGCTVHFASKEDNP